MALTDRSEFQRLILQIERDLLADRPEREHAPECFACGRAYPCRGPDGDDSGRFCSPGCRIAYDAGFPAYERQRELSRGFPDPSKPFRLVAGRLPACGRCGALCVETYMGKGGAVFCCWRCRDDKPRDCVVCGKWLNASGRRGPYCSDGCANTTRKAKKAKMAMDSQTPK